MDPIARLWAERQLQRLERAKLRKLIIDLREQQDALQPLIKAAADRRQRNMRQDGPTGFVMVPRSAPPPTPQETP